jgi:hypothetical protein
VASSCHRQCVDKRLSIARQLLASIADNQGKNTLYRDGCIDAALLQLNFALAHYCNELLEAYQRPLIDSYPFSLKQTYATESAFIAELVEFKQLAKKQESWLAIALNHPSVMLQQGLAAVASSTPTPETTRVKTIDDKNTIQLIDVINHSDDNQLPLNIEYVQWIVDECCALIQRQREHLIEC